MHGGRLVTNGGRVLNVTGLGPTLDAARETAYAACASISFDGMQYRRDIAGKTADVAT
jgi:phosphoribosylamine--glycine ligase